MMVRCLEIIKRHINVYFSRMLFIIALRNRLVYKVSADLLGVYLAVTCVVPI